MSKSPRFESWPRILGSVVLLTLGLSPALDASTSNEPKYTAQRQPRVTVLEFADTNTDAGLERFGSSVSAMLVTYLKRNTQFVVVERQDIKEILSEWQRNQKGLTTLNLSQSKAELLEKIDVFITGKVTVLTEAKNKDSDTRIEIDAKLLARTDGRIIAAVQRSGLRNCLRQTVSRLGAAIQHDYLRPHFGKLRVTLDSPEHTRFYLTPILRIDALDEEKPPVELGATTFPGEEYDLVSPWITNPTSYTIENLLSGWYTVRLERPGYGAAEVDSSRFQTVEIRGDLKVRHLEDDGQWVLVDRADPNAPWRKFLLEVKPLTRTLLNASLAGFHLPGLYGSVHLAVLDEKSNPLKTARIYLRSLDLALNPESPDDGVFFKPQSSPASGQPAQAGDPAADASETPVDKGPANQAAGEVLASLQAAEDSAPSEKEKDQPVRVTVVNVPPTPPAAKEKPTEPAHCEFLVRQEMPRKRSTEGRVLRSEGGFDVATVNGGYLAFEDYRGELVPIGQYEVVVQASHYIPVQRFVNVSAGDGDHPLVVRLERDYRTVLIRGNSDNEIVFKGESTGIERRYRPDPVTGVRRIALPVERYQVSANLKRFGSWRRTLNLLPEEEEEEPPTLEEVFPQPEPSFQRSTKAQEPVEIPLKDELWVGGRTDGLLPVPEVFYDQRVKHQLNQVLSISQATRQISLLKGEANDLQNLDSLLQEIDLLILNEVDLARLRLLPDVAQRIRSFIEDGRAVLVFATHKGDYESVLGAPFEIRKKMGTATKLVLTPGEVPAFSLEESIDLGGRRAIPKLDPGSQSSADWRVLSYSKRGKQARLLERGDTADGGYVMVWLESSATKAQHRSQDTLPAGLLARLKGLGTTAVEARLPSLARSKVGSLGLDSALGPQKDSTGNIAEDLVAELFAAHKDRQLTKKNARKLALAWSEEQEANDRLELLKLEIFNRALDWAEYLLYRRLGKLPDKLEEARKKLSAAH